MLFNIVGSMAAGALDRRKGVSGPLAFGMLGGMLSGIVVGASTTVFGFGIGYFIYGFACFFVLPYQLGAGAALDATGRAATLAGAAVYLASAISPLIGGLILDHASLAAVGWGAAAACLIAALCAFALGGALDVGPRYPLPTPRVAVLR